MSELDELAALWRNQAEGFRLAGTARDMEATVAAEAKRRRRASQWVVGLNAALVLVIAALTFVGVYAFAPSAPFGIKVLAVLVAHSGGGLALVFVIRRNRRNRSHRRLASEGVEPELRRALEITVQEQRELRGFVAVGGCLFGLELGMILVMTDGTSGLNEAARRVLAVSAALNLGGGLLTWWHWRKALREQRREQEARVVGLQ